MPREIIKPRGPAWLKGKMMTPTNNGTGYMTVMLSKDATYTRHTVHKLVAHVFVDGYAREVFRLIILTVIKRITKHLI